MTLRELLEITKNVDPRADLVIRTEDEFGSEIKGIVTDISVTTKYSSGEEVVYQQVILEA